MDAASERARFRDAVDRLRESTGVSMDEVAKEFGVSLNLAHRWRAETGRHKPRAGWEVVLAGMAQPSAALALAALAVAAGAGLASLPSR